MRFKTLRVLAALCLAGGFLWLVIHLELTNWDEPLPGSQAVSPAHLTQPPGAAVPSRSAQDGGGRPASR